VTQTGLAITRAIAEFPLRLLIANALVAARLISSEDFDRLVEIIRESVDARKAIGTLDADRAAHSGAEVMRPNPAHAAYGVSIQMSVG
jgi:hypothetical protein